MRKSETFTALNGLRFLAALAVVIFHYAPRVGGYARLPEILKNLIEEGPAAVGFFFILSGFVLAHRHLNGGPRVQAADFYWARFARLYPAYLLAFLLFLPVALQRYVVNPSPGNTGRHTFVSQRGSFLPHAPIMDALGAGLERPQLVFIGGSVHVS